MKKNTQLPGVEAAIRVHLRKAREITNGFEGKALSAEAQLEVEEHLAHVQDLSVQRKSLLEGTEDADRIRADIDAGSSTPGFKALAKSLSVGDPRQGKTWRGKTEDFLGKTVTATDITDARGGTTTDVIPGIQRLTEDLRRVSQSLPSQPSGDDLHVQEFRITARTPSGSSQRDPLSTSSKATLAVTVEDVVADFVQHALIANGLPVALLKSEPALETALRASLGIQLRNDLDTYVLGVLETAATYPNAAVLAASGIAAKVRQAMLQVAGNGGTATHAILNDSDVASFELLTEANTIGAWPFGLTIISTPDVLTGDGIVFDASGVALYFGAIDVATDPYAGVDGNNFSKNMVDIRAEANSLAFVREAAKLVKLDASFAT